MLPHDTSTGSPVGTDHEERFMLQAGVVVRFGELFQRTKVVEYGAIVIGQLVVALSQST